MAKKKQAQKKQTRKSSEKKSSMKEKIISQVKEPLSLLETLKEEGMARAFSLMSAAGEASRHINKDKLFMQMADAFHMAGMVTRTDIKALEERIQELEAQIEDLRSSVDECSIGSSGGCGGECDCSDEDE